MEIETLKGSNLKRNIIIGVVVVAIIVACIITLTRAKYRTVASTTLIRGTVNYTALADLNIVAITVDGKELDDLPRGGDYYNLLDTSYCEVEGEGITVTLSWDNATRALSVTPYTTKGTECYLDFETATKPVDTVLGEIKVKLGVVTLGSNSCEDGSNKDSSGTEYNDGNCTVEENGIYEGEDDYGPTYYYRGTVNNNWVSFAGFYWRIIRINGDGTVRLIYSGEDSPAETGTDTQIDTSAFNSGSTPGHSVGYTYTSSQQRPTTGTSGTSSAIKEVLDSWYQTYLSSYSSYIADSGFCNDREVTYGTWRTQETVQNSGEWRYAAYTRGSSGATFKCYNDSGYEDLYTVSINNGIGNGSLTYAIGLITADEVWYAGAYSTNYGYWLNTESDYWTMTPARHYGYNARGYFVVEGGSTSNGGSIYSVSTSHGVRPVINLATSVEITGSGTIEDPYVVKTS